MADKKIIGNFELIERIGQGGMGAVFKARQISMDRIIALKVLPPRLAKQGTFIERFMREAHAVARLNHPNIVRGIDVGEDAGVYYLAMEFVDGTSAKKLIKPGGIPEEQVLKIGKAVAEALAHAHSQGILHRDIKPDNILIDKEGTPKLCDLGLARLDTHIEEDHSLTQAGTAMGTPFYISPEQARGDADLDAKTDLYSLGATLYHLLTGKPLFDGPTSAVVMIKHLTAKCPNPADEGIQVSRGLMMILGKLLAKERAERYESASVLAEDLNRVIHGNLPQNAAMPSAKWPFSGGLPSASLRRPIGTPTTGAPAERSRSRAQEAGSATTWLVLGGVATLLIIVAVVVINGGKAKPPEPAAAPVVPAAAPAANPAPPAVSTEQLEQALQVAQDYAKRDPDNYPAIIAEFDKVRILAAGTDIEGKARQEIEDTRKRQDAGTEAAAQQFSNQAGILEAQGKFDSAIAVWDQAPAKNPLISAERAAKADSEVRGRAETKLQGLLDAGQQCLTAGKWEDGRKVVAEARVLEYAAGQARLEDLSARILTAEQAEAAASRSASEGKAQTAFAQRMEQFMAATLKQDLRAARKIAADAHADPDLQPFTDKVQDMAALCNSLQRIERSHQDALLALKDGKQHEFEKQNQDKVSGIVASVSPIEISLLITVPGGDSSSSAAMPVRIADLSARQRSRLAGNFKPQAPVDFLALGVNACAAGDIPAAKTDLDAAKDFSLTAAFIERLDEQLMGAVEGAAKADWLKLVAQIPAGTLTQFAAADLDKRIKAFLAEHGQTKFAASVADKITNLQMLIDLSLNVELIQPGSFLMGSPPGEPERGRSELQHKVTLTHAFYMGKYLVRQALYQSVMGDNPSSTQQPQLPVDRVSWLQTQEFCSRLSTLSGRTVRLPTEAEWEYACRAGTTTMYYFGDDASQIGDNAWFKDNTSELPAVPGQDRVWRLTNPTGVKKPNPWGLYDMCGNLCEWCQDWYEPYTDFEQVDPKGPDQGRGRVVRGGSGYVPPRECRSASRTGYSPDRNSSHLGGFGFRIVIEVADSKAR